MKISIKVDETIVGLCVSIFVVMLGLGGIAPLIPVYAQTLGATGIWLGIMFSGFSISRAVFIPLMGRLSDRVGKRRIFLIVGLTVYGITLMGYLFSSTVYELTLVRFLNGFGSAMVLPICRDLEYGRVPWHGVWPIYSWSSIRKLWNGDSVFVSWRPCDSLPYHNTIHSERA